MLKRFFIWLCYNETLDVHVKNETLDSGELQCIYYLTFWRLYKFINWGSDKAPDSCLKLRCIEKDGKLSVIDGGFLENSRSLATFKGTDSAQISLSSGYYYYKVNGYKYKSRSFNNIQLKK